MGPHPVIVAALCALLVAGVLLRLRAWPLHAAAALALGGWLAWLATGPEGQEPARIPRTVRIVHVDGAGSADSPALAASLLAEADPLLDRVVAEPVGSEEWIGRLHAIAAARDAQTAELTVCLVGGPLAPPDRARRRAASGAYLVALATPLPFDPRALLADPSALPAAGRPLRIEVRVPAGTGGGALTLAGPDGESTRPLADDGPKRIVFDEQGWPAGSQPFALRLEHPSGARVTRAGEIRVGPPPRVLVRGGEGALVAALEAQGFAVDRRDSLPQVLEGYDAVVVTTPPLPEEAAGLAGFVDAGGGLFVAGGALVPDGPLGALLPVRVERDGPDPAGEGAAAEEPAAEPEERPERPESAPTPPAPESSREVPAGGALLPVAKRAARKVAMAILIDRSGSMAELASDGRTKLALALAAALETAKRLDPADEILVVTFAGSEELMLPRGPASRPAISAALQRIQAGGRTYVMKSLEMARKELARSDASLKHVVIVTDGVFLDTSWESKSLGDVLDAFRNEGITVSGIGIAGQDLRREDFRTLEIMTHRGGGRISMALDATELPRILVAEVERVAGIARPGPGAEPADSPTPARPPEPPRAPQPDAPPARPETRDTEQPGPQRPAPAATKLAVHRVTKSPALAGLPEGDLPPVDRVVANSARSGAVVLLAAGDRGLPLLAVRSVGLGRVAVWTSGETVDWAGDWLAARWFPALLAQWVSDCLPPSPPLRVSVASATVRLEEARASHLASPPALDTGSGAMATVVIGAWTLATAGPSAAAGGDRLTADWILGEPIVEPRVPSGPQLEAAARAAGGRVEILERLAPLRVELRAARASMLPWLAVFAALLLVPLFWLERAESRRGDG